MRLIKIITTVLTISMMTLVISGCTSNEVSEPLPEMIDVGDDTPNQNSINIMLNIKDWNVERSSIEDLSEGDIIHFTNDDGTNGKITLGADEEATELTWHDEGYAEDCAILLNDGENTYDVTVNAKEGSIIVGDTENNKIIAILQAA